MILLVEIDVSFWRLGAYILMVTYLMIHLFQLRESGEKERLKELLRERLVECGWRDEMRALCRFL